MVNTINQKDQYEGGKASGQILTVKNPYSHKLPKP